MEKLTKGELFLTIFRNKILNRLLFRFIHQISKIIGGKDGVYCWSQVLNKLHILAYNNNVEQFLSSCNGDLTMIRDVDYKHSIVYSIKGNSIDLLKYFVDNDEELHSKQLTYLYDRETLFKGDLLYYAVMFNRLNIMQYLVSISPSLANRESKSTTTTTTTKTKSTPSIKVNKDNIKIWNYNEALKVAPLSNNIEIFKYILDKIDLDKLLFETNIIINNYNSNNNNNNNNNSNNFNFKNFYDSLVIDTFLEEGFQVIRNAARMGRDDMIDLYLNLIGIRDVMLIDAEGIILNVIKGGGHLHILNKYYGQLNILEGISLSTECDLMDKAAQLNYFGILQFLHQRKIGICTKNAMEYAAENGNLEMIQWLHNNRTEGCTSRAMTMAAQYGYLDIVVWLHKNRTEGCNTNSIILAASRGHYEVMIFLSLNRTEEFNYNAMDGAAANGHLKIVQWLHHNRTEGCTTKAMDKAAGKGNMEMVEWLFSNRTERCTITAMVKAAANGHLDAIKWLHTNCGLKFSIVAFADAAQNKHFDILKWMVQEYHNIDFNMAIAQALKSGHFEILRWLCSQASKSGRVSLVPTFSDAIKYGHCQIARWLIPSNINSKQLLQLRGLAFHKGYYDIVLWLDSLESKSKSGTACIIN